MRLSGICMLPCGIELLLGGVNSYCFYFQYIILWYINLIMVKRQLNLLFISCSWMIGENVEVFWGFWRKNQISRN